MQGGDAHSAASLFGQGAQLYSSDSSLWLNAAVAQATVLMTDGVAGQFEQFCEARAAAMLASRLGSESAAELLRTIDSELAPPRAGCCRAGGRVGC
jgi:hypothetical protein